MFFIIPSIFVGLSVAGPAAIITAVVITVIAVSLVVIITALQRRRPEALPATLRDWLFLPAWMRSLEPYDRLVCAPVSKAMPACCQSKGDTPAAKGGAKGGAVVQQTSASDELEMSQINLGSSVTEAPDAHDIAVANSRLGTTVQVA